MRIRGTAGPWRCLVLLLAHSAVLSVPGPANATWSVVATDSQTGEVGIAGASCIAGVEIIAGIAPGKGAVASQARINTQSRDYAVTRLNEGAGPAEIISEIANSTYDYNFQQRQFGIVALGSAPAAFTGNQTMEWAGHETGDSVAVQGNILYGADVVGDALAAFEVEPDECPFTLSDRLMAALEAGAAKGGDNRCTEEQSALSAFVMVARSGDSASDPYLKIIIPGQSKDGFTNPVELLREDYDAWRAANPPDGSVCDTDTGTDGDSDVDSDTETAGDDDDSDDDDDDDDNNNDNDDDNDDNDSASGSNDSSSGCGCRATGAFGGSVLIRLLLLIAR